MSESEIKSSEKKNVECECAEKERKKELLNCSGSRHHWTGNNNNHF